MSTSIVECSIRSSQLDSCPGLYCGRVPIATPNGTCYSSCTACPAGFRVGINGSSECVPCSDNALLRDYLFLGFVCLMCTAVRLAIIHATNIYKPPNFAKLGVCGFTVAENGLAFLFTLLVLHPQGSLWFHACPVLQISDFYPIFYNPTRDYVSPIDCSYEVVYPLYRMVFIYSAFSFLNHLLLLPLLILLIVKATSSRLNPLMEFLWLVAFPIIVVVFAVCTGLLYFSFDYITVIISLGSFAVVSTLSQLTKYGFKNPFKLYTSVEQWVFTVVCMLYLAYGIVSLTEVGVLTFRAQLIPLVLAPPLLHPLLSYFASPQQYLTSWGLQSYRNFYDY